MSWKGKFAITHSVVDYNFYFYVYRWPAKSVGHHSGGNGS